jgi:tetratricopeptide (TPR) repeat protein
VYSNEVEKKPDNWMTLKRRAIAYAILGRWEQSVTDFSKALALNPTDPDLYEKRGHVYMRTGNSKGMLDDYTKAIELKPNFQWYWHERGYANMGLENWEEVIRDYSKVTSLNPSGGGGWERRGQAYAHLKQWDKAIADLSKAAELNPDYAYLPCLTALLHLYTGDIQGYRNKCNQMFERFGKSEKPEDVHWVSWTHVLGPDATQDFNELVQLAEQSVQSDDTKDRYLSALGAILYRAGRYTETIKEFSELTNKWEQGKELPTLTSPAYTWYFLSMAHQQLGHSDEAKSWFDKAVERSDEEMEGNPSWNRKLTLQLLRKEAEKLLGAPQ